MAYSKETQRQNQALGNILAGRETEKRVMVGYKGEGKEKDDIIPKMTEIMQDVRMPLFCKKCDKVMKKRLDDKMWFMYDHCFDCQIKKEHKMRIEGTYDDWMKNKILSNKLAWIKDQKILIKEFKNQKTPEFLQQINPDGHSVDKEKWDIDENSIIKQADEALEFLQKMEDSLK